MPIFFFLLALKNDLICYSAFSFCKSLVTALCAFNLPWVDSFVSFHFEGTTWIGKIVWETMFTAIITTSSFLLHAKDNACQTQS